MVLFPSNETEFQDNQAHEICQTMSQEPQRIEEAVKIKSSETSLECSSDMIKKEC